jgi:mRNA-degrading endonuclease RelE of RelBE toxin-antitoxin system
MVYKARLPNSFQKDTKKLPENIKSKVIKEIRIYEKRYISDQGFGRGCATDFNLFGGIDKMIRYLISA